MSISNIVSNVVGDVVEGIDGVTVSETLIAEYEITLGDIKIATKDGEAMFWDNSDTVDFSTYEGDDAGSTPYKAIMFDSADKQLVAYGGAAGADELSAEIGGTL